MQILHLQEERPLPTASEAHLPQGVEGPGLDRLRAEHGQAFRAGLHPQEVQQIGSSRLGIQAHLLQTQTHPGGDRLGAVRLGDAAVVPQDVQQGR